jgi:lysophospholipase L1-like esterase
MGHSAGGFPMINILCYGDSNTWGRKPLEDTRFPLDVRWPGVLRQQLGSGYWVIEEGLNGRTTVWDDPVAEGRSGKGYLVPCLNTHKPLDLVALMLGSNDLKPKFSLTAYEVARGAATLLEIIQKSGAGPDGQSPQVLLISPPHVIPLDIESEWRDQFEGAAEKSRQLARYYTTVAQQFGVHFLDAATVMLSSPRDGIHFEAEGHARLGSAVAQKVRAIFEGG